MAAFIRLESRFGKCKTSSFSRFGSIRSGPKCSTERITKSAFHQGTRSRLSKARAPLLQHWGHFSYECNVLPFAVLPLSVRVLRSSEEYLYLAKQIFFFHLLTTSIFHRLIRQLRFLPGLLLDLSERARFLDNYMSFALVRSCEVLSSGCELGFAKTRFSPNMFSSIRIPKL